VAGEQQSPLVIFPRWVVKNPRALFLGQWENRIRYGEIKLTAVSGEGRLLRGGAPPRGSGGPRVSVDLLPLIDPRQDSVQGEFKRDGAGLLTPNGVSWARIMVPYIPPSEYDLTMVVEAEGELELSESRAALETRGKCRS